MADFKVKVLCRYRRNEGKNKYSIEFCKINHTEYAVYGLQNGDIKCWKIGTDYHEVKEFFKKCVVTNI